MTLTAAPTLHTTRLALRGPEKADLAPFTAWVTGSARMVHVGGNGTPESAWRGFIAGIGHWHWHGYGFFSVTDRETGAVLGRVGILNHLGWPEPELAWHMFDGAEGRGIAYEAALAVRRWAGEALGLGPLVSLVAPDNARSLALAARLGAVAERDHIHDDGETVILHRHLRHDAPAALAQEPGA